MAINIEAFCAMVAAEEQYLLANGWTRVKHGKWRISSVGPHQGEVYFQWRAVVFQREADSKALKPLNNYEEDLG